MSRIRLITDSACDLPQDIVAALDIDVVSLSIRFGDDEFVDRVDLSPAQFWARCASSKVLPETAAPAPGAFHDAYERARGAGYDGALVVTLSAALSATNQSATLAASQTPDFAVRVVDSQAVSMALGLMVLDLAETARGGSSLDELEARALDLRGRVGVCGTLDTLEHLVKGGRVGGARALLGQVLAIKPLLELKDGVVAEAGRQRTRARALAAIVEVARQHAPLERLAIVHGDAPDVASVVSLAASIPLVHPVIVTDMGPVVGTHGGPRIVALCWISGSPAPLHS
ncbi:MAG TPA: DegV family protein [Acidimicrobiales bacterium]|nr:DegV family protein [Acidimicrobiales bacterium]